MSTNNPNKVRETIAVKNRKSSGFTQTSPPQDYRDFINYMPGEDMLRNDTNNADLPFLGLQATSLVDARTGCER